MKEKKKILKIVCYGSLACALSTSIYPFVRLSVDHPPSKFSCSTWIRLLSISKMLLKIKKFKARVCYEGGLKV